MLKQDHIYQDNGDATNETIEFDQFGLEILWKRGGGLLLRKNGKHVEESSFISVDDNGSHLSKINTNSEALLMDSDGAVGLAKCLRAENMPAKSVLSYRPQYSQLLNNSVVQGNRKGTFVYTPVQSEQRISYEETSEKAMLSGLFCEITSPGDLSSLTWVHSKFEPTAVRVVFSALNFRDPMVALRRINIDTLPYDRQKSYLRECSCNLHIYVTHDI